MSTWVFEGALAVALFLVLAPLLLIPFLGFVYRRYRYLPVLPTLLALASGLYACSLVTFTLFPLPASADLRCTQASLSDYWQLAPGGSIRPAIEQFGEAGLSATLTSGTFLQVAFNVLFFVPLGLLIAYVLRKGILFGAAAGLAVSLLIEVSQGSALYGLYPCPYRLADVDDLALNTLGAVVGWLLGAGLHRLLPFRDPPRRDDRSSPRLLRRGLAGICDLILLILLDAFIEVSVLVIAGVRGDDALEVQQSLWPVLPLVAATLFLLVPLLRRDRATPGQIAVLVAPSRVEGSGRVPAWSVLVRFAVRWLPMLLWQPLGVLVVIVVEAVTALLRKDRRSLSGLLARTRTRTRDDLAAAGLGRDQHEVSGAPQTRIDTD